MTWRHFDGYGDTTALDGPSPADLERADDANYAGDFSTMVAIFRAAIADDRLRFSAASERTTFAKHLRYLATLMVDGWGAPDAQFPQQCLDDHGPQIILRAMAKAYEQPEHVVSDVVEHP